MRLHAVEEKIDDPQVALQMLKYGNNRFVEGNLRPKEAYKEELAILDHGQTPFAVIVGCSDSRVGPEVLFDQMLGDLFVIRSAGNVLDCVGLGSIEYAVEHLHTPLIVIMGHDHCGAVTAACSESTFPKNIKVIVDMIRPSYKKVEKHTAAIYDMHTFEDMDAHMFEHTQHYIQAKTHTNLEDHIHDHVVEAACLENVFSMVEKVSQNEIVKKFGALVVPAKFEIHTGRVEWYD